MARALLLVIVFGSLLAEPGYAQDWRNRFPYVHAPIPRYYAYEYASDVTNARELVQYFRKLRRKMRHSSDEVESYFAVRNQLGPHALDLGSHYDFVEQQPSCTLAAVGDVMWVPDGSHDLLSAPLVNRLASHDLRFVNLESQIVPGQPTGRLYERGVGFNSDPSLADALATGGQAGRCVPIDQPLFNVVSIANNHSLDRGRHGLQITARQLQHRGMTPVGMSYTSAAGDLEGRYVILERNGYRVAFIALTYLVNREELTDVPAEQYLNLLPLNCFGYIPDLSLLDQLIARSRAEGADVIAVSVHWGYQFEWYPHPHFMVLAREFAARGADLVIGHHQHVLQPLEVLHVNVPEYQETLHYVEDATDPSPRTCLVIYSLGNFASPMPTGSCKVGGLLSVELQRAVHRSSGKTRCLVRNAQLLPVYSQAQGGVVPRQLVVHDVTSVLAGSSTKLRTEIRQALEDAELERIGTAWLAGQSR